MADRAFTDRRGRAHQAGGGPVIGHFQFGGGIGIAGLSGTA
jgi:hypothetical protein